MRIVLLSGLISMVLLPLNSCMSHIGTRNTYVSQPGVDVNGARISMAVKPEGTDNGAFSFSAMVVGVAVANLNGPFAWRIEAEGVEGVHEKFKVERIRTITSETKRDEWYPRQYLRVNVPFSKKKAYDAGVVKAVYDVPGRLEVKPKEDGALTVLADVVVTTKEKRVRKTVKFLLDPTRKKDREMIFLPAEIVQSIGRPMDEWEDKGWD